MEYRRGCPVLQEASLEESVGVVNERHEVGREIEPALDLEYNGESYIAGLRPCSTSDDTG